MDNTRLLLLGNMFLRLQLLALLLLFVEQTNGAGCGPNQEMRCPGCEASCEKGYYQRCPSSCKPSAKKCFCKQNYYRKGNNSCVKECRTCYEYHPFPEKCPPAGVKFNFVMSAATNNSMVADCCYGSNIRGPKTCYAYNPIKQKCPPVGAKYDYASSSATSSKYKADCCYGLNIRGPTTCYAYRPIGEKCPPSDGKFDYASSAINPKDQAECCYGFKAKN